MMAGMDTQTEVKQILDTGITQAALAARIPCSQALISALLHGKRGRRPTYDIAVRLKEIYVEVVTPKS
jgi:transcriptional regulator with XRE-family HTH domain